MGAMTSMINVVIDNSGSMRDNGKASLAANVFRIFKRELPADTEINFYRWDTEVAQIDSPAGLRFLGSTDSASLETFIAERNYEPILLVGDGVTEPSLNAILKKSGSMYVAVGCDSDVSGLGRSIGRGRVFSWADCVACLHLYMASNAIT